MAKTVILTVYVIICILSLIVSGQANMDEEMYEFTEPARMAMYPAKSESELPIEPEYLPTNNDIERAAFLEDEASMFANALPGNVEEGPQGFHLQPGTNFRPGYYQPPTVPYRFPSHPFDNPSYTATASQYPVPLPPPWRSDPFEIHSDGARYLTHMDKYDHYTGGSKDATPAQ